MLFDFGSANQWDFRAVVEFRTKADGSAFAGIDGGGTETIVAGNLTTSLDNTAAYFLTATQTLSAAFPAASAPGVINRVGYSWTHRWTHVATNPSSSATVFGNYVGFSYGFAPINPEAFLISYRLTHADHTAGNAGGPDAHSRTLLGPTFDRNFPVVTTVIPSLADGQSTESYPSVSTSIHRSDILENLVAKVYHVQTEVNSLLIDNYDYNLAGAQVLLSGTMQYIVNG
jgi:hypothetical protein